MNYFLAHPFTSLILIFSLAAAALAWLVFDIRWKWNRVFGKRASARNEVLEEAMQRLLKIESVLAEIEPRVNVLEEIGRAALQKVGFTRFNPFNDTGGDQSFAVALLDRENNGVVISSLYTREGVRTYAKYIEKGVPKHLLSEEEKMVLRQALES